MNNLRRPSKKKECMVVCGLLLAFILAFMLCANAIFLYTESESEKRINIDKAVTYGGSKEKMFCIFHHDHTMCIQNDLIAEYVR